ncbi:MAG: alpha/beta hydrolase [Sphingomonadaceae bacterium]|nr:alpha/beta hydrolase [Sphingomonadaceae bacterium]
MANEILTELFAGLRANGPDFSAEPEVARAQFGGLLETIPVDEAFAFTNLSLGDVPAVMASFEGAGEDGALLYFHGGAYVTGSAQGYRGLAAELGRATGVPAYAVDYRLAPEHPCPAAVEDAVAAYRALLASGISPEKIVFAGDSAGGGLTLAALVQLRDDGTPLPAAALLISPWLDLACEGDTIASKEAADPSLTPSGLRNMAAHYMAGADSKNPLGSPLYADLSGLPPLLVQVGAAEILLSDSTRLATRAGEANTAIDLQIWPDMPHVFHAFHFMLPEARAAIDHAGRALRARMEG